MDPSLFGMPNVLPLDDTPFDHAILSTGTDDVREGTAGALSKDQMGSRVMVHSIF